MKTKRLATSNWQIAPADNPRKDIRYSLFSIRRPERGSTLIDVLFSTLIIGIIVTSLFLAFSLANRIALRTKHISIGKGVAETEIELVRRTSYDTVTIGTTTTTVSTLPDGQKTIAIAYYDPPTNKVKQITVTVTWDERNGTESFILQTLATQGGTGQ